MQKRLAVLTALLATILLTASILSSGQSVSALDPEITPEVTAEVPITAPAYTSLARYRVVGVNEDDPSIIRGIVVDADASGKLNVFDTGLEVGRSHPDCQPTHISLSESGNYFVAVCASGTAQIGYVDFKNDSLDVYGYEAIPEELLALLDGGELHRIKITDTTRGAAMLLDNGSSVVAVYESDPSMLTDPRKVKFSAGPNLFTDIGHTWSIFVGEDHQVEVLGTFDFLLPGQPSVVFTLLERPMRILSVHLVYTLLPDYTVLVAVPESGSLLLYELLPDGSEKLTETDCPVPFDPYKVEVRPMGAEGEYTVIASKHQRGICTLVIDNLTAGIVSTEDFPAGAAALDYDVAWLGEQTILAWIDPDGVQKFELIEYQVGN